MLLHVLHDIFFCKLVRLVTCFVLLVETKEVQHQLRFQQGILILDQVCNDSV